MSNATGVYAKGTTVAPAASRDEIERTLERFGASAFGYARDESQVMVQFRAQGRMVRFIVPFPDLKDFAYTPSTHQRRTKQGQQKAYEDEIKRRWRALALGIKAKLEMVSTGLVTFEEEFLAHIILPNGQVVGEWIKPQLEASYQSNQMPKALPGMPESTT